MQVISNNIIRADHPNNGKRSSVYIFYTETLGVRVISLSSLSECIIWEVSIQTLKGSLIFYIDFQANMPFKTILNDTIQLMLL